MKKSVYSLVLMDDVIAEIDRLAYEQNTNRSNLINQILAKSIDLTTPEMKMNDIFSELEMLLSESTYQIMDRRSDSLFSFRSVIRYKYRPIIKYQVELFRNPKDVVARLKLSFRSSSKNFIVSCENFFLLWNKIEEDLLKKISVKFLNGSFENIRYTKEFSNIVEEFSDKKMAESIGAYIKLLDSCIKFYFENIEDMELIEKQIENNYKNYLSRDVYIV